jgi:hypothetical protein
MDPTKKRVRKRRPAEVSDALPPNIETLRAAKPIVPKLFDQFPEHKKKRARKKH